MVDRDLDVVTAWGGICGSWELEDVPVAKNCDEVGEGCGQIFGRGAEIDAAGGFDQIIEEDFFGKGDCKGFGQAEDGDGGVGGDVSDVGASYGVVAGVAAGEDEQDAASGKG